MIMETKRLKQDDGTEEDQAPKTVLEDRLSELPDGVILHILSFLPTLVAFRMSLLSKRWRCLWTLVPTLDFRDVRDVSYFRRCGEKDIAHKMFLKFVDECLKRPYSDTIFKFTLDVSYYGSVDPIDSWLWFPISKNVKELDLRFRKTRVTYVLPDPVLRLRSLTLLRLNCVALGTLSTARLPSLKVLHLESVEMDDQTLNNLLLGSSSLEELCLNHCTGLLDPQVSSSSLRSMVIRIGGLHCRCRTIKVTAINLHSFEFLGSYGGSGKCRIDLFWCRAIRNLSLHRAYLAQQCFEDLIPQLPRLESLNLNRCNGLLRIKILNRRLKNFVFISESDLQLDLLEATIDAPSLLHFHYTCSSMLKISMNAPNLLDADIRIFDYPRETYDEDWYIALMKFLSEFNGCKNIYMFCFSKEALIVPDELRKIYTPPLPDLKYLKVRAAECPTFRQIMLRNSLLWIAPSLETLLIE